MELLVPNYNTGRLSHVSNRAARYAVSEEELGGNHGLLNTANDDDIAVLAELTGFVPHRELHPPSPNVAHTPRASLWTSTRAAAEFPPESHNNNLRRNSGTNGTIASPSFPRLARRLQERTAHAAALPPSALQQQAASSEEARSTLGAHPVLPHLSRRLVQRGLPPLPPVPSQQSEEVTVDHVSAVLAAGSPPPLAPAAALSTGTGQGGAVRAEQGPSEAQLAVQALASPVEVSPEVADTVQPGGKAGGAFEPVGAASDVDRPRTLPPRQAAAAAADSDSDAPVLPPAAEAPAAAPALAVGSPPSNPSSAQSRTRTRTAIASAAAAAASPTAVGTPFRTHSLGLGDPAGRGSGAAGPQSTPRLPGSAQPPPPLPLGPSAFSLDAPPAAEVLAAAMSDASKALNAAAVADIDASDRPVVSGYLAGNVQGRHAFAKTSVMPLTAAGVPTIAPGSILDSVLRQRLPGRKSRVRPRKPRALKLLELGRDELERKASGGPCVLPPHTNTRTHHL